MTAGILVFSRFDSVRLPGKALIALAGKPLLSRVLERLRALHPALPIFVATSDRPVDDAIAELADNEQVGVFRGSCDDVAGRALACAQLHGLETFIRVTGDSPFVPIDVMTQLRDLQQNTGADLATNAFPRSFPVGMTVEVIQTQALQRAIAASDDPEDREHLTRHMYRYTDAFRIENVCLDEDLSQQNVSVDTVEDLERAHRIMDTLGPSWATASAHEVIGALKSSTLEQNTVAQ